VGQGHWASIFDDPEIFVASTEAEAIHSAQQKYGCEIRVLSKSPSSELDPIFDQIINDEKDGKPRWEPIWRDEDVLDTWFSSALWPFSTLGWPNETPELKRFYPTSALVTGFDIIFFWVARMMMMGLHFQKEVPFRDVYIHRLVRDATGAKMSKSKGNVVDPLDVIDEYGADALRFTLARNVAPGHDIRLGPQDVENNRNFATKLWNAARFAEMNGCARDESFDPEKATETLNRWILTSLSDVLGSIEIAIGNYRFNDAAGLAYQFVWNTYCDWYLELAKPILQGHIEAEQRETRATTAYVLDQILKLLHPFMPFITEELWRVTAERPVLLALEKWPVGNLYFGEEFGGINWLIDLISKVRSVRVEMNIPAADMLQLVIVGGAHDIVRGWAATHGPAIQRLARISKIDFSEVPPQGSAQIITLGGLVCLPLIGVIDLAAERARLAKEMANADADIARVDAKLGNPNFMARAPEEVVDEEKEKRAEAVGRKQKIAEALDRLKGAK
jgi:valyl-tRNA synthetase